MMMQNKFPLIVFLAGILSKTSGDPYRFVLIDETKTWTEAQLYCRETYMDLATVQSDEDRAKLQEAANAENFTSDAWIGFYYEDLSWRWSYQHTAVSYTNWDSQEPNLSNTNVACVTVNINGQWDDEYCTGQNYFFCQTDEQDKLQDKFKYNDKYLNWLDAQMFCISHKSVLATISDNKENTYLAEIISEKHEWKAWIGLSKNLSQWYWSDQTDLSWSSVEWQKQVNNTAVKGCARADTDGLMTDDNCSIPLPFYCRENTKVQSVRVTVKSDGHLEESAVMEAIKTKMKQIFLEDNIYSITWSVQPDGEIFQQQITQENKDNTQDIPTACEDVGPM